MEVEEERVDERVDERSVDDLLSFINGDGGISFCLLCICHICSQFYLSVSLGLENPYLLCIFVSAFISFYYRG